MINYGDLVRGRIKRSVAFNQKYFKYAKNQVWDLEPASYNSYRIVHQVSGMNLSTYKYSLNTGPKKDAQLSINTANGRSTSTWDSAWSIKMVGNSESPCIYEISRAFSGTWEWAADMTHLIEDKSCPAL